MESIWNDYYNYFQNIPPILLGFCEDSWCETLNTCVFQFNSIGLLILYYLLGVLKIVMNDLVEIYCVDLLSSSKSFLFQGSHLFYKSYEFHISKIISCPIPVVSYSFYNLFCHILSHLSQFLTHSALRTVLKRPSTKSYTILFSLKKNCVHVQVYAL